MANLDRLAVRFQAAQQSSDLHTRDHAWAILSAAIEPALRRLVAAWVPKGDREDCQQMICVRVFRCIGRYSRTKGRFLSWFRVLAKNQIKDFLRAEVRRKEYGEEVRRRNAPGREAERPDLDSEHVERLLECISLLAPREAQALQAHANSESESEIARRLGVSHNQAKVLLREAKRHVETLFTLGRTASRGAEIESRSGTRLGIERYFDQLVLLRFLESVKPRRRGRAGCLSEAEAIELADRAITHPRFNESMAHIRGCKECGAVLQAKMRAAAAVRLEDILRAAGSLQPIPFRWSRFRQLQGQNITLASGKELVVDRVSAEQIWLAENGRRQKEPVRKEWMLKLWVDLWKIGHLCGRYFEERLGLSTDEEGMAKRVRPRAIFGLLVAGYPDELSLSQKGDPCEMGRSCLHVKEAKG